MDWYYSEAGQQKGPVTGEQVQGLVRDGVIRADTLVWREGLAAWQPYGQLSGGAAAGDSAASLVTCSQCGKSVPADQVIRYGEQAVCAECKPAFAQRIKEGLAPTSGLRGSVSPDEIIARDYDVSISDAFSAGWEAVKGQFWPCIGATCLVYLVLMVGNFIPFIGGIVTLIIQGPLIGGLYLFYIKRVRNQEATIGDAFSGFGPRFLNLMLTQVVTSILAGLCMIPGIALLVIGGLVGWRGGRMDFSAGGPLMIVGGLLLVLAIFVLIYLSICWMFAIPLVADKRMGFWQAMNLSRKVVGKHWWMCFALMLVGGLFAGLGILAVCVGFLVTISIFMGMTASLYDKIFGDMALQDG